MPTFKAPASPKPPLAKKQTYSQTHHGQTTQDDYHWLRAENWQEALRDPELLPAEIKDYLHAENAYYDAAMADTMDLQGTLIDEMRGRMQDDVSYVPEKWGDYAYNIRYAAGQEHPIFFRTPRDGGAEQILLDFNKEAEGFEYFESGNTELSPEQKQLAWSVDTAGSEYFALKIRHISTGQDHDYEIADVSSVAWLNEDILIYTRVDENHRSNQAYRHQLGTDPKTDTLIMTEKDPRFDIHAQRSLSGDYIFLHAGTNDEDEIWFIPTATPLTEPQLIQAREQGIEYNVDHQDENFIIMTNADAAEDFKIVTAPVSAPQRDNWKTRVEHQPGTIILGTVIYQDWLIWSERANALPRINIRSKAGDIHQIEFAEEAYSLAMDSSLEFDGHELRFIYSSPTTPAQTYDYDLNTRQRTLRKEQIIPSGHDSSDYITRRISAISHDGAEVPITLLYHKDTQLNGTAPCFLYGYGSYGHSLPANFSANRLSLVDRGFVHAVAHTRGGEEKGRAWYEAAKLEKKPNTFHDFIAVAQHLIAEKYTAKGNIVCSGASAGGLLIGAVVNMAPELFAGAEADVPFVDMLNTILDDTLPLTPGEWTQWGNPIESAEAYQWIKSYSPYDNVTAQAYPPMLVTAGVSDPRVTYWEPAKWVAKLRVTKTDDHVLMLRTNMSSGHFGKSGRYAGLEDLARTYAFALKCTSQ